MNIATSFVEDAAARHPSRCAVAGDGEPVTYGDLAKLAASAGDVLRQLGCGRGDRVLLALPDSVDFLAGFFGAAMLGAVAVPIPPLSTPSAFERCLAEVTPRLAIVHASALGALRVVSCGVAQRDLRVLTLDDAALSPGELNWHVTLSHADERLKAIDVPPDHPAAVLYTSGSTAGQKAVVHSHANFLAAATHVGEAVFGLRPEDRLFSLSRLTFGFGLGFGMYMPLSAGACTILDRQPGDLQRTAALIAQYRPTIVAAVPSALAALLKLSASCLTLDLSSVRFIASAGEPLPLQILHAYRDRFGIEIVDGIGSTEMLTHFISNRPGASAADSCGTPVPSCSVRLLDDDGAVVPDGEVGQAWVTGATMFLGYWNDPSATVTGRGVRWIRTGDRMRRDVDGRYHYCGRQDDCLKVAGMWVSSQEIEVVLCRHPAVERAFVTTKKDRTGMRRLVAFVVPTAGAEIRSTELLRHVGSHLPAHMMPTAFVVLGQLPLTPNGKVARGLLPAPSWRQ